MSVLRHSSSRGLGQANAWNRANASRRRSTSQEGSSRPWRKDSKAGAVKPSVCVERSLVGIDEMSRILRLWPRFGCRLAGASAEGPHAFNISMFRLSPLFRPGLAPLSDVLHQGLRERAVDALDGGILDTDPDLVYGVTGTQPIVCLGDPVHDLPPK